MASKWFFPTAHADQSNQPEAEPITGVHGEEPDEPEDPRTEIVQGKFTWGLIGRMRGEKVRVSEAPSR